MTRFSVAFSLKLVDSTAAQLDFWVVLPLCSSPTIQMIAKLRFERNVYVIAHPKKQISAKFRRFEDKRPKYSILYINSFSFSRIRSWSLNF